MKLISMTATILLAFCMACSTTDPIPEPEPTHPASSSASVPIVAGPSDLLASHDPLPQLSTQQAPDDAMENDHDAMQHDQSTTEPDHDAMHPAPEPPETEQPAHDHGQSESDQMEPAPPDSHDTHDAHDAEPEPVVYACPMHPDQRSNEPADCPICGMKMEPVEVEP